MTGRDAETVTIPGVTGEVTVRIDRWGIPHIEAQNDRDLFIAQGFVVARDRLYQLDLWRRRGTGLLAEVFGPDYLEQDAANRLLLYRGDMEEEWAAYGPEARGIVEAFVHGINAYVELTRQDPALLPVEFTVGGYAPAPWTIEDVVASRTHGLLYNAEAELARALTVRDAGAEVERLRHTREPADPLRVPHGLAPEVLHDGMLDTYRKAFLPVTFGGRERDRATAVSGSNNWVVSGGRTATGRPILANDPHRAVTLPSLRYVVHLKSPTIDVIGAGEPALPGVSIGHNQSVAFGLTIWPTDQEDLYVYALNPDDPGEYAYQGGWRRFAATLEQIPVRGQEPHEVTHLFTCHGPVIHHDPVAGVAVGLRAAWLEPGMAPYLGSLAYLRAANAEEFRGALRHWGTPSVNQVYATVDGDIGWQAAAKVPRRPTWDGGFPVPGDGTYEWSGLAGAADLPSSHNPAVGWFASSNQMNVPDSFDTDALPLGHEWYSDSRYRRIEEWLGDDDRVSVQRSDEMQFDAKSIDALRVIGALRTVRYEGIEQGALWRRLLDWDGVASVASVEATVFEIWLRRHFRPWLVERAIAHLAGDAVAQARARKALLRDDTNGSDLRNDLAMLDEVTRPGQDQLEILTAAVDQTLTAATVEIAALLGPDQEAWRWGRFHHTQLQHALLAPTADAGTDADAGTGPAHGQEPAVLPRVERAGTGETVGLASYDSSGAQVIGSSFRFVADVGDWDSSVVINAPGQSGDPRSPHYRDLYEDWADGATVQMAYTPGAVAAVTTQVLRIVGPAS